jgi:hypothetical protein
VNLRNIVILGCRTLNEIADASPGLSRGLLSKRLRDLERAGILEIRRKLARDRLPQRRTLVRFDYPTLSGPGSRGWLLVERGDGEICETYPGGEEDLVVVVHEPLAFAHWHLGEIEWGHALRSGAIEVRGSRALARGLPTWRRDHEHGPQPRHAVASS